MVEFTWIPVSSLFLDDHLDLHENARSVLNAKNKENERRRKKYNAENSNTSSKKDKKKKRKKKKKKKKNGKTKKKEDFWKPVQANIDFLRQCDSVESVLLLEILSVLLY